MRETISRPGRIWTVLVLVVVLLLTLGATPGHVAADDTRPTAIFVSGSGEMQVLHGDGSTTPLGQSAGVVGPMRDYDGDGEGEAPFVDSNGHLAIIDADGQVQALASGAASSKTTLASGDWDGDGTPAVLYANSSDNGYLYRAEVGETPQRVVAKQAKGALGVRDFDSDGTRDVVFVGGSSTIKYFDGSSVHSTGYSSIGSNNGLGTGPLADFDGDGTPRVPVVDGSNNLALVDANGSADVLNSNYQSAVKAPVAAADWTGDDRPEVLHLNNDNKELAYATLGGETGPVQDPNDDKVLGSSLGVAPVVDTTPPNVTAFDASNPGGRTLAVSFNSSEQLAEIRVDLSGDATATLTEANFSVSGSGPYAYAATYDASSDGDYTFRLETAQSSGGDGASGQSDSVTVDTPDPAISNASLTDLTDGDWAVDDGDTVRVSASISGVENGTVTANLSALGEGTISLAETNDGEYAGSVQVDASSVPDGWARAMVTATNQYDKTAMSGTDEIALDTKSPTARTGSDRTVTVGESVTFDGGESIDSVDIERYRWDFDDGDGAVGKTVVHQYDSPGIYVVSLTAADLTGHTDTTTVRIEVEDTSTPTPTPTPDQDPTPTPTPDQDPTPTPTPDQDPTPTPTPDQDPTPTPTPEQNPASTPTPEQNPASTSEEDESTRHIVASFDAASANSTTGLVRLSARTNASSLDLSANHTDTTPAGVPSLANRPGIDVARYANVSYETPSSAILSATMTVEVDRSDVGEAPPGDVSVYRYSEGTWTRLPTMPIDTAGQTHRYRASSPGLSTFAIGVADAAISKKRTKLHARSVRPGEPVRVTVELYNSGAVEGRTSVALAVDGTQTERTTVSVPAGESQNVTLTATFDSPGTYRLRVDGTNAGTVTVTSVSRQQLNPLGVPPMPGCGPHCDIPLVGLLAVVFGTALAVRRRRRPEVTRSLDSLFNR